MACPFFLPLERFANGAWPHPARLPLGCGWTGQCTAPGHEGAVPDLQVLQDYCNLGYAHQCSRIPNDRPWDSVRFAVAAQTGEARSFTRTISIQYVCERDHRPIEHGRLSFNPTSSSWASRHQDDRIQRMAECFLEAWIARNERTPAPDLAN